MNSAGEIHNQKVGATMADRACGLICVLLVVFLWGLVPPDHVAAATLTVDDDGQDCPGAPFTTISAAMLGSAPGDVIVLCTGTYVEQVTINKSVTLAASTGQTPVIMAPAEMALPKAIVRITGSGVTVRIEGLTISGPGAAGCDSLESGIRVDGGAHAVIRNNRISEIRDNPLSSCQNGVAIRVGKQSEGEIGTAIIQTNIIQGYQKAGIVVDNAGSRAVIAENQITGSGPTSITPQSGVQVSRGATGEVTANAISGHLYTGCGEQDAARTGCLRFVAAGLLLFEVRTTDVSQSANTFRGNQSNVVVVTDLLLAPGP
jgi:nitrous oxidase accessory protein NosD